MYHCNLEKSDFDFCRDQYDWLVKEMKKRIGDPPEGVSYPVWAWYMWEGCRKKPDLEEKDGETAGTENGLPVWKWMFRKKRLSC